MTLLTFYWPRSYLGTWQFHRESPEDNNEAVWAAAGQVGTCLGRHLAEKLRCANIKVEVSWTLITLNHILTDVGQLPEHKIMTIVAY